MTKTKAYKITLPEYKIVDGCYVFSDGIKIPVEYVASAVRSINKDAREIIGEAAGEPYELIVLRRRYNAELSEQLARTAMLNELAEEEKKKMARMKAWVEENVKEGRLVFYDRVNDKLIYKELPDDLTDLSFEKLNSMQFPNGELTQDIPATDMKKTHTAKYQAVFFKRSRISW